MPARKGRRTLEGFLIFGEGEMPGEEQQADLDGPRCLDSPSKASTNLNPCLDANVPCGHVP